MKKKILALFLVFALALALGIGGTLAWLTAESGTVTNTFTIGDINIYLDEAKVGSTTGERVRASQSFEGFVPGATISKDPTVTVEANSEACWLFVEITESTNLDKFISYSVDTTKWTAVGDSAPNVYYIEVNTTTAAAGKSYTVLTDNQVTVNSSVTKSDVNDLGELKNDGTYDYTNAAWPSLTFKAYAIQSENLKIGDADVNTAAQAWTLISNP